MLQLGGHHLAYNFTFNGHLPGATPLFFGSEPIRFEMKGATYAPLDAQSGAMSKLAAAVAAHPGARLSGTFTDVVKGVVTAGTPGQHMTGGIDTGFPQSYPTGKEDRGVLVSSLQPAQRQLAREAIESSRRSRVAPFPRHCSPPTSIPMRSKRPTWGTPATPRSAPKDLTCASTGPRAWMELVVQPAIAHPEELHYHALWRDKQSDYGGEIRH